MYDYVQSNGYFVRQIFLMIIFCFLGEEWLIDIRKRKTNGRNMLY
jgi:hypothetical protein